MNRSHEYWVDYLRVLAIGAVLVIHVTAPYLEKYETIPHFDWWIMNVLSRFSQFAVPLFMMLSGYLLVGKYDSVESFYKMRLKRLALPSIFWNLLYFIKVAYAGDGVREALSGFFWNGTSYFHLWYLTMLFWVLLYAPFIDYFVSHRIFNQKDCEALVKVVLLTITVFWLTVILRNFGYSVSWFKNFPFYLGYYFLGHYCGKYYEKLNVYASCLSIIALVLIGSFLNYYRINNLKMIEGRIFFGGLSPFIFILVLLIFTTFRKVFSQVKGNHFFCYLSSCAFGIYLVHPLIQELYSYVFSNFQIRPFLSIIFELIFVTVFSFFMIFLLRKTRFGKIIC